MARHYGRSPRGQRCLSALPHGHWQTSTFVAALRYDHSDAPFLVEGPMDGEAFSAYLAQVLCPQLRPGDTLILDNLSTHKVPNVSRLLSACGAQVRYLPPYSPDLNPMESRPSPNSRRICVKPPPEPWQSSSARWQTPSMPFPPPTVRPSFVTPNIRLSKS